MATLQDVIRRITIQASAQGADAATASLQKLATAQGAVAVATTNTDKATLSATTRLNSLQRSVDTAYASEVKMASVEKTLTAARNEGLISAERETELLTLATAKYAEAGAAAELMAKGEEIAGEAAKGLLASLGPLLALTALAELPNKIMETAESVSKIGENAETIGTTSKELQELDYAAQQSGVSTDTMNSALERFSKNLGVAQTGTGNLAKVLKANGIGITGDTIKDLENYANLVQGATTAEQRNFLITTAFGKGAAELGPVFRDGADGIQELIDKADSANVVLSDGTIESAHQLNQEFQSLEAQLNATFEEFIINIAPTLEATLQGLTNLVRAANAVVDVGKIAWDTAANADLPLAQQSTEYLERDLAVQQKLYAEAQANPHGMAAGAFDQNTAGYQTKATAEQGELDKRGAADIDQFVAGNDGLNGGWGTLPKPTKSYTSAGTAATDTAEKQANQFAKMIATTDASTASLVAQQNALGLNTLDATKLTEQTKLLGEAQEKNINLSPDQLKAIDDASTAYAQQEAKLQALTEIYDDGKQASEDFFSTLKSDLMNGTSLWGSLGDAAGKALDDIASKATQMAADGIWNMIFGGLAGGGSSGGGIASGLLGLLGIGKGSSATASLGVGDNGVIGGFAMGGYTGSGGVDAPAGFVHGQEFVINAAATARNRPLLEAINAGAHGYSDGGYLHPLRGYSSGGYVAPAANSNSTPQGVHVTVGVAVDNNGNLQAYVQNVSQSATQSGIAAYDQKLGTRVSVQARHAVDNRRDMRGWKT